jgi:hypothetical protein
MGVTTGGAMKKKTTKKLVLAKETVRSLEEMAAVVAGEGDSFEFACDSVPRYRCRLEPSVPC